MASSALALLLASRLFAMTDKAETVDALFRDYHRPGSPGASVMVIRDGQVLYRRSFGLANLEEGTPNTLETNFRLASLTKQFTAMATLILAERGWLSLDHSLIHFFPDFPAYGKDVTVKHLLQHTSGLVDYEDLIPQGATIPLKDRDVLTLVSRRDHPDFPPGSRFRYSNSGYALLALMVERATELPFARFLKESIFRPLAMGGTVAYEKGTSDIVRRAYGYSRRGEGFELTDQSLTSSVLGDGGVYSSVEDLYRWDQALYTSKLVRRETLEQAFTPGAATDGSDNGYGYGWFISRYRGLKRVWHYGDTIGFSTFIARFPERRFTVIVLINLNDVEAAPLVDRIVDTYLF